MRLVIVAVTTLFYLLFIGLANAQTERKYTYQSLNIQLPPGTARIVDLIDLNADRGEIVGTGADSLGYYHGLIINRQTGIATRIDCDGPDSDTTVNVVHNLGSIAGGCISNATGPAEGRISRGFIFRPQAGNERIFFRPPGADGNVEVTALNDDGACVLTYTVPPDGRAGHYRWRTAWCDGPEISVPVANSVTVVTGLNRRMQLSGYYYTFDPITAECSVAHGFFADNGTFTQIDFSGTPDTTAMVDLNNDAQMLGFYGCCVNFATSNGGAARFLYDDGKFVSPSLPTPSPGAILAGISLNGLNDNDEIIGRYTEVTDTAPYGTYKTVWFVAAPEPLVLAKVKKPKKVK
jgi:hypothetical protein